MSIIKLLSGLVISTATTVALAGTPHHGNHAKPAATQPATSSLKFRVINRSIAAIVSQLILPADSILDSSSGATRVAFDPNYTNLDQDQARLGAQLSFKTTFWNVGQPTLVNVLAQLNSTPDTNDSNSAVAAKVTAAAQTNVLALFHWFASTALAAVDPDDSDAGEALNSALTDLSTATSMASVKTDLDQIKAALLEADVDEGLKDALNAMEFDLSGDQRTLSISFDATATIDDPDQFKTVLIAIQATRASLNVGVELDLVEATADVDSIKTGTHDSLLSLQNPNQPTNDNVKTALGAAFDFLRSFIGEGSD